MSTSLTPRSQSFFSKPIVLAALLALVTLVLYWPATGHKFVNYDDPDYITSNSTVSDGLSPSGVVWAFTHAIAGNWHPVTVLSHMLDCQLFGLNPWGHHLVNLILHALNAALVFWLLRQLTGATWRSLFVAVLFAVHPLRVESVAWIAERKDLLCGFFGLLSLLYYVKHVQIQDQAALKRWPMISFLLSKFYGLSLLFFALGLMSKPMLVTWPFVLLLLDYWPLDRFAQVRARPLLAEKIPFFILAVVSSVVTFLVQSRGGAVVSAEVLPFAARVANALHSYCAYIGKMIWPVDLAVFYPHPGQWPVATIVFSGVFLAIVSVVFILLRRRAPFLLVGWLFFLGTQIPIIGLVQIGSLAFADRYTYLPLLGLFIAIVWGAELLTRERRDLRLACVVGGTMAIFICLTLTGEQLTYWQNSETLFRHALQVTENNSLAQMNLANSLNEAGRTDEAIQHFAESLRLQPDNALAHNNLGIAYSQKGQTNEALAEYREAIRLQPDYATGYYNLGNYYFRIDQVEDAIRCYRQSIQLQPDSGLAHNALGLALSRIGQLDEAFRELQTAVTLLPKYADAHFGLAKIYAGKNKKDDAIREFQITLALQPNNADAHYYLGTALGLKGKTEEAIRHFQETIRLKPGHAGAYYNLGIALDQLGQTGSAIIQFNAAILCSPNYVMAYNHLGLALYKTGQTNDAILAFKQALHYAPDYTAARINLEHAQGITNAPAKP